MAAVEHQGHQGPVVVANDAGPADDALERPAHGQAQPRAADHARQAAQPLGKLRAQQAPEQESPEAGVVCRSPGWR